MFFFISMISVRTGFLLLIIMVRTGCQQVYSQNKLTPHSLSDISNEREKETESRAREGRERERKRGRERDTGDKHKRKTETIDRKRAI